MPLQDFMKDEQLLALIDKYLAGEATDIEKQQLDQWYQQNSDQEAVWNIDFDSEDELLEKRMLYHLKSHVRVTRPKVFKLNARFIQSAAAVLIGVFLITGYFVLNKHKVAVNQPPLLASAPVKFSENKFVLLPDSSTVLIHSGSTISYAMKGKNRELKLIGEAYFDIKHLADHPFVIYTGKVKTTVLGTAFNIKAYPGQNVVVSVTRGKVSVANESRHAIATLVANQQAVYRIDADNLGQSTVEAKQTITWAKQDMQFDGMPYSLLAERLSRRYGVDVKFKNENLAKCLITGRFTGTESLDQVLKTLSDIVGSTYTIDGKTVLLDGTGCN
jgi:transmembrane sensor